MHMNDFRHLSVRFYTTPEPDKKASLEAGRPIHKDVEMCEIRLAGDPKTVRHCYANELSPFSDPTTGEKLTYAQLHVGPYQAFKEGVVLNEGTPLEVLGLPPSRVADLKALAVFTVEQLARLEGANLQRLGMGARDLKNKAQAIIDNRPSEDVQELKNRIAQLEAMIEGKIRETDPPAREQLKAPVQPGATVTAKVEGPVDHGEPPADLADTPFWNWADDDLKNWLDDAGYDKAIPPNIKHETLVRRCVEHAKAIQKQEEAA